MREQYYEPEPQISCPKEILAGIAIKAASIEAESRYLQAVGNPEEDAQKQEVRRLNEEWMQLNGMVREIVVEKPEELGIFFQQTYSDSLLNAFQQVREERLKTT